MYVHTHTPHLSVDGHLGCFHILATVNSAAMNTGVYLSELVFLFFFSGYIPKEWNCWIVEIHLIRSSILIKHLSNWCLNLCTWKIFLSAIGCNIKKKKATIYPIPTWSQYHALYIICNFYNKPEGRYYLPHVLRQEPETERD